MWSMVLVYPTFTIPFCTWLLMGFFKSIPWDIEEQAMIDGYSRLGAIWRTVLPLSMPGILTVVVFSFALTLHEFVYALAFVTSSDQKTITIGVTTELIRGRRLLLAIADGRGGHRGDPGGLPLQPLPRPLHRRLHARRGEGLVRRGDGRGVIGCRDGCGCRVIGEGDGVIGRTTERVLSPYHR